MATLPEMNGDVYWGDPDKPLPDWRKEDDNDEDDDEPEPLDREYLTSVLGFDPFEEEES